MSFKFKPKLVIATVFVLSLAFAVQTFAADNVLKTYKDLYTSKQPALENWSKSNFESTAASAYDAIIDFQSIPDEILAGKMVDNNGNPIVWIPGGMVGSVNKITASLFAPTASGVQYVASLKDQLLGKPAYAQDTGASSLSPILPVWRGFRNIVYILSSIIFVIIGIMIILRVKISPQAIISIQNAIPQLIITLILVTFSYAIAGLLIDLSTLIQAVFATLLYPMQTTTPFAQFIAQIPVVNSLVINPESIVNPNSLTFLSLLLLPLITSALLGGTIASIIGMLSGPAGAIALGGVATIIVGLVFAVIIIFKLISLLIGLVKVYATIIFKIVISPLEIGMGAFPGSKMGFSSWINDLIGNLAVFPAVFIFLLISNYIISQILLAGARFQITQWFAGNADISGGLWAPSIIGGGLGALNPVGSLAVFGIGFTTIVLLPKLPELIPALVFQLKNPWGQAIGQATNDTMKYPRSIGYNATGDFLGPTGIGGKWINSKIPFFGGAISQAASDSLKNEAKK